MSKPLDEYSREELLEYIKSLKRAKKFGLVYENKPEDVTARTKTELPVLEEVADRAISKAEDAPTNLIIEGDNYHSLAALNYTHAGKVDAIYADPPYNTGAKNWIYDNDYVDGNDTFRHSKWLSFMEKRLRLAKSLLKDEGIIVITIDDYEIATLTLLMNEIFGEENRLGTIVIKNNPSGRSTTAGFAVAHEYALFYAKSATAKIGRLARTDEQIARYKEKDESSNFEWVNFRARYSTNAPSMQYPIFIKKDGSDFRIPNLKWDSTSKQYELLEQAESDEIVRYPVDEANNMRSWKWSIETTRKSKDTELAVRLDKNKKPAVYMKARMKDAGMLPLTWWDKTEYSATAYGTNLLNKILYGEDKFDYPKSLYAVMDSLRVLTENPNALILDFFAGSGTTGHAALELNKLDNGNRSFILCTNNDNGIAENITYRRIQKVIEGYDSVEGIPANVRYFKTEFVKKQKTDDQTRLAIVDHCIDMVRIREDTFTEVINEPDFKLYKNVDHYTAIIFEPLGIAEYIKRLEQEIDTTKPIRLYNFSYSSYAHDQDIPETTLNYTTCSIPESVLEVYQRIFKTENT